MTGFYSALLLPFYPTETKIQTRQPFSPERLIEFVEKYKVDAMYVSTPYLCLFLQSPVAESADMKSLKLIKCGGSILSNQLLTLIHSKFPLVRLMNCYGSTELIISNGEPEKLSSSATSAGKLLVNTVVKITDESGNRLGVGESGEIAANSSQMFLVSITN